MKSIIATLCAMAVGPRFYIDQPGAGGSSAANSGANPANPGSQPAVEVKVAKGQVFLEKGKSVLKQAFEFAGIGLGVALLGFAAGAGFKAGTRTTDRLADRNTMTGGEGDGTMTTGQAGARGGRQRAA